MRLFLFDLDGTLVTTGGAGLRALEKSFEELFQIQNAVDSVNPSGKTDPTIFREIARVHLQKEISSEEMESIAQCYLRHLEREMAASVKKGPLPGVKEFLQHLRGRKDIAIGLGTGNLEKGARIKLSPMNLNSFFSFGGFGSDAEDRAEVLKFGQRRAAEFIRQILDPSSVFVIGDTNLDVEAARRAGFRSVAVASGGVSYDELEASRPDFLLRSMEDGFEFLRDLDGGLKKQKNEFA